MTYGKSKDKYSFFYDPMYTMQTTVNGQLLISVLIEDLILAGFDVFMANTDGITTMVPNEKEEEYYKICKDWEGFSRLQLEYGEYSKMVITSVNDYIAVYTNGKVKYKGDFVYELDVWKNPSFKIIPIALSEYYIKDVPFEETITKFPHQYDIFDGKGTKKSTTIFDYMGRSKMTQGNKLVEKYFDNGELIENELTKTTRYYISTNGVKLIKVLPPLEKHLIGDVEKMKSFNQMSIFDEIEDVRDSSNIKREEEINAGRLCTISNKFIQKEFDEYNFDFNFYLNECEKIKQKLITC